MPSSPSNRLGLVSPLGVENANGPDLADDLITQLEAKVGLAKISEVAAPSGGYFVLTPDTDFNHLKVVGMMRGKNTSVGPDIIFTAGISGVPYSYQVRNSDGTLYTSGSHQNINVLGKLQKVVGGASMTAEDFSHVELDVFNFSAGSHRVWKSTVWGFPAGGSPSATGIFLQQAWGIIDSVAAITELRFRDGSAFNGDTDGVFTLYGMP
jgi:hypothetical protein